MGHVWLPTVSTESKFMTFFGCLPVFLLVACLVLPSSAVAAAAAPTFTSAPTISGVPQVGSVITVCVAATDPQGLPLTITYVYGDGSSDTLGKHVYTAAGVYLITVTITNGATSVSASLSITIKEIANLWIKRQTLTVGDLGKQSWHAKYIYNADRTLANRFNPASDRFAASLGAMPRIQIPGGDNSAGQFSGLMPQFVYRSADLVTPSILVIVNENSQTISINEVSETVTDQVPGVFHNIVQMGANYYFLDQVLDASGTFTANSGYRSTAFVVSEAMIAVGKQGKGSAMFSMLLGDPTFSFPGASGAKAVHVRVTNVVNQIVIDNDLTNSVISKAGILKSGKDITAPVGSFHYNSKNGNMTFHLSKATLTGLLTTSEEHVRVDVTIGDQTYTTHVTLFAAKAGSYSTTLPKKFTNFIPGRIVDTTPPTVISTVPANSGTSVAFNTKISATFSEAMNPLTMTTAIFTVQQGTTIIPGAVAYAGNTATFTPAASLTAATTYIATITTGATDLAGNALVCNYIWTFTTASADTTPPNVISTIPANSAVGVAINSKITVTFSEAMDLSTLNAGTLTLMQGATAVSGALTFAANGTTATFKPSSNLIINSMYTATVTTGAKDLAGNALAANYIWNFTTGAAADTTPPTVTSTNPADLASNVAINHTVNATFSEAIDPATINTANFTLAGPGPGSNPIMGTVAYDSLNNIATFTPGSNLAPNTQFTATVTTGVKDLAGNALALNKVWTFTTGTQQVLKPLDLGTVAPYGTFGGGSGMTNQGTLTVVNGDIGSTGASTTVTGFHDNTGDIYTETPLNKGQVNGRIYTDAPPPAHPGGVPVGGNATTFAIATQAAADANTAYNNLSPASIPGGMDPGAGQLGGLVLAPGVYKSAGATFMITGSDLTLDAQGDSNAVWVFQMAASLTVGGPGAPRSVIMINGAQPKNVFWYVGSSATINGAGGGTMVGTIIASSGVTFSTAGNVTLVTLNGRALSLHASTTLVNTIINVPAP